METQSLCVFAYIHACVCECVYFIWGEYIFADTLKGIPRTALLITSGDHRDGAVTHMRFRTLFRKLNSNTIANNNAPGKIFFPLLNIYGSINLPDDAPDFPICVTDLVKPAYISCYLCLRDTSPSLYYSSQKQCCLSLTYPVSNTTVSMSI